MTHSDSIKDKLTRAVQLQSDALDKVHRMLVHGSCYRETREVTKYIESVFGEVSSVFSGERGDQ